MLEQISIKGQRWVLRQVDRWSERASRTRSEPQHLRVGERGEREAFFSLREQGYTMVARRWRTGRLRGDLDLVGWDGDTLCFIEVKTRSERVVEDPAEAAVDRDKRRTLRGMARAYLKGFPEDRRDAVLARFDVASVYLGGGAGQTGKVEVEVVRDAFGWRE